MAWYELAETRQGADKIASSPSSGKVLKVSSNGTSVEWADDSGGAFGTTGTVAHYTAGNVGIGTTSPAGTLEIENSSGSASFIIDGSASNWQQIVFKSGGSTVAEIANFHEARLEHKSHSGIHRFDKLASANYIQIDTANSGINAKGSTNLYLSADNGNASLVLGYSGSTPVLSANSGGTIKVSSELDFTGAKLWVSGTNKRILFGDKTSNYEGSRIDHGNGIQIYNSGDLHFQANGGTTTIGRTASGTQVYMPQRLGIGVASPSVPLEVNGNAEIDGTIQIEGDANTKVRAGDGGGTYGGLYSEGTYGDVELVLNSTNGASPDINFQVAGTPTAAIASIAGSSDLRFRTNGNSSDKVIIDSSGKVGIGTAPDSHLHIRGTTPAIRVQNDGESTYLAMYHIAGKARIFTEGSAALHLGAGSNGDRLRIATTGYIGLSVDPEKQFHIGQLADDAGIRLSGYDNMANRDADIYLDQFGQLQIKNNVQSDSLGDPNIVITANQSGKLYSYADLVLPSSKVGIGTESPSSTLEVDGTTEMNWGGAYTDTSMANFKSVNNAGFYIRSYYAGGIGVAMNPITGGGVGGGRLVLASHDYRYYLLGSTGASAATLTSAGDIALGTGGTGQNAEGTKRLYIKNSDGSIGLGTDNPHSNLHINSSSNLSWIQFNNSSATHGVNTGSKFGINGSHAYVWNYENADIYLGTNNATAVRIHASGKAEFTGIVDAVNYKINGAQGSDGQVLTSTGSGVAWEDASGGSSLWSESGGGTSNIYRSSGGVGIGTDSPTEKLHVVGEFAVEETSSSNGLIKFRDTDQAILGQIGMARGTDQIATGSVNLDMVSRIEYDNKFMWTQQNTTRMTLASTGLEVNSGSIHMDTNNKFLTGRNTYNSDVVPLLGMNSSNWVVVGPNGFGLKSGTGNVIDDGGGNATFAGTLFLQTASPNISMRKLVSGSYTWFNEFKITGADNDTILKTSQHGQDLIFGTADVEKMRLKGANLGIGTDDPQGNLSITASSNPLLTITETTSGTGASGGIAFSNQTESTYRKAGIYFNRTESTANRGYLGFALDANASTANVDADWAGNTKMVVNYDGNVGIGTDSPTSKLQVSPDNNDLTSDAALGLWVKGTNGGIKIGRHSGNDGAFTHIYTDVASTDFAYIVTNDRTSGGIATDRIAGADQNPVNNYIELKGYDKIFSRLGVTQMTMGNGKVYYENVNVGINCTDPAEKLEVRNGHLAVTEGYNLILRRDGGRIRWSANGLSSGSNNAEIYMQSDTAMRLAFGGVDKHVITDSGIGIGTTSSNNKLDVAGDMKLTPVNSKLKWHDDTVYITASSDDGIYLFADSAMKFRVGKTLNSSFQNFSSDGYVSAPYFRATTINENTIIRANNTGIDVDIQDVAGTSLAYFESSNKTLGINTTSPLAGSKLDVVNVAAAGNEATGVGAIRIQDYNVNVRNNAHGGLEFKQASNQGYKLGTNAGDNTFSFLARSGSASWSETMTFSQDKVGIGQTTPAYALDVSHKGSGNLRLRGASNKSAGSNTYAYLQTPDSSNEMAMTIKSYTNTYWAIQGMEQGIGWKPIVLNEYGGNVGIQDTSPSSTLSVGGNAEFVTSGHTWKINGYTFGTTSNSDWELLAGGSAKMVIYNAGDIKINNKLGVGGISPDTTLHIEGESVTHSHGKLETALGADIDDSVKVIDHIATRITTDNSAEEMFLDGSSTRLVIPSNTSWFFKVNVVAMQVANGVRTGGYSFEGVIMNDDDTVSMPTDSSGNSVANPTRTFQNEWNSSMTCDLSADDTNKTLKIAIKGMGDRTHWVADIHIVQTKF